MSKRPNSRVNLDKAIERLFGAGPKFIEARSVLANAIVGQFLPDGVAKGGSALKLRFGTDGFRATRDLDAARRGRLSEFEAVLGERLREGWCGFSGTVAAVRPAAPRGVPPAYVMRPFEVKLSYLGKSWCTVDLEVGHDEIGDADAPEFGLAPDVAAMFEALGFPAPAPVPLMPLRYQVAQKLHGVTSPGSRRAHDLIDLQLIVARAELEFSEIRALCVRLFAYRQQQTWPPVAMAGTDWESLYAAQRGNLPVLPTAAEAVEWANALIARIDAAR